MHKIWQSSTLLTIDGTYDLSEPIPVESRVARTDTPAPKVESENWTQEEYIGVAYP